MITKEFVQILTPGNLLSSGLELKTNLSGIVGEHVIVTEIYLLCNDSETSTRPANILPCFTSFPIN